MKGFFNLVGRVQDEKTYPKVIDSHMTLNIVNVCRCGNYDLKVDAREPLVPKGLVVAPKQQSLQHADVKCVYQMMKTS